VAAHPEGVDDSRIIEQCRALGDPVRWAIVRELQGGTRCACVLARVTDVSNTLLSHHLKVLREAELVTVQRRGRWMDYTLADDEFAVLGGSLAGASVMSQ
jgi:ArsR family transcriptional regulator